ncbi:MAG: MbnP family protein [Ginsengibacter sp.]
MINFKINKTLIVLITFLIFFISFNEAKIDTDEASIKIIFINTINNSRIVLNDSIYTNPFNEKYSISKLRYYISNVCLENASDTFKEHDSYHLIDESKEASQSFSFSVPEGRYNSLQFLIGVDSLHNVSGAQTDALDPANDMFWTWNSGYVMAKMEGNSPASKVVNNKYEFHIGGFSGQSSVLKEVVVNFPPATEVFKAKNTYTFIIDADINTWWQNPHDIKIADHPVITTPGINAKNISDNYANMFHIEKVITE